MEFVLTHDGSGSGQHSAYAGFADRHDGGRQQQADTGGANYNEQSDVESPLRSASAGEVVDNEAINIWV
ncbi:MAG: hypothetical protein EHM48_05625 [Planctomycetaceae bacterium]|nr:MAG: hypothetical protein EHM48_05625 [Planctomycetaceae bacterium]